jgi:hypothetical protein
MDRFSCSSSISLCHFGAVIESSTTQASQGVEDTKYFYRDGEFVDFKMKRALYPVNLNASAMPPNPTNGGNIENYAKSKTRGVPIDRAVLRHARIKYNL